MKIPSLKKIEKQVAQFGEQFKFSTEKQRELNNLEKEHSALCKEWSKIRDSFCNGEPCICATHPKHGEYLSKIQSLDKAISEIYAEKLQAQKQKRKELISAKLAKEKYARNK